MTVTIGNASTSAVETYTYTIQSGDNFTSVVDGLVALINAGQGDPNVIATTDIKANEVVLTAKVSGSAGNNVSLATSISPAQRSPPSPRRPICRAAEARHPSRPARWCRSWGPTQRPDGLRSGQHERLTLGGVSVYFNGIQSPLLYVSPTQINAQIPFNFGFINTGTATAWVRIQRNDGTIVATNSVAVTVVPANPVFSRVPGPLPARRWPTIPPATRPASCPWMARLKPATSPRFASVRVPR